MRGDELQNALAGDRGVPAVGAEPANNGLDRLAEQRPEGLGRLDRVEAHHRDADWVRSLSAQVVTAITGSVTVVHHR